MLLHLSEWDRNRLPPGLDKIIRSNMVESILLSCQTDVNQCRVYPYIVLYMMTTGISVSNVGSCFQVLVDGTFAGNTHICLVKSMVSCKIS